MEERLVAFVGREEEARGSISDGAARFLLHQIGETAADCLARFGQSRFAYSIVRHSSNWPLGN